MAEKITRRERVLRYLQQHPGVWINAPMLASPDVGGSEGLRRIRELRQDGVPIEMRRHPDRRRAVRQYRLKAEGVDNVIPLRAVTGVWVRGHYRERAPQNSEVTSMADRDFIWEPFNHSYGPWYRLRGERHGVSVNLSSGGHPVEVVVIPDMNKSSWFWSVTFAKYTPRSRRATPDPKKVALAEKKVTGRAETREEAQQRAMEALQRGRGL